MRLGIQEESKKEKTKRESQEEKETEIRRRLISSELILMLSLESQVEVKDQVQTKERHTSMQECLIASFAISSHKRVLSHRVPRIRLLGNF